MKQSDFGVVAVVYVIIFFFLSMTLQLPQEAQTYPLVLLSALFFLNTLYIGLAYLKYRAEGQIHRDLGRIFKDFLPVQFLFVALGAGLYVALIELVGYFVASAIYLVASLVFFKVKASFIVICIALLMVTIYLVFAMFLNVPLPVGMLFE